MAFNGTVVGSPTFGAAKFSNGLTSTSDSNYISLPSGVFPNAGTITWEAWLKTTAAGAVQVALSCVDSVSTNWMGLSASGTFMIANSTSTYDSGVTINDGNWHHCAVVSNSGTDLEIYVDGSRAAIISGHTFDAAGTTQMYIGRYGVATGFGWGGAIDEVALWNAARYTGSTYTVPTAPYTGSEPNLHALYHLQSDGTDSANGTPTTINPNDASILYSPFNWNVTSGFARAVNAGAYFRTIFSGTSVSLATDTSPNTSPYPQVWARVDNQGWQLFTLAAGNPTLIVGTGLDGSKKHILEVVVKSTSEFETRWSSPQAIVQFTGIVLDAGNALTAPTRRTKNVLIMGDSITEGYHVYGSGTPDTSSSDALGCYAYALTTALDAEVGVVGWGGQGVTVGGQGGVPSFPSSYSLIYSGVSRSFSSPAPDLVIYNYGTNDSSSITSGLTTVVNAILAAAPSSKHLLLVPFNGTHASEIAAVVSGIGLPAVTSVSTTGWFNTADSVDGVHPYNYSSVEFIAPLLFPQALAVLYPSSGGSTPGGSYAAA